MARLMLRPSVCQSCRVSILKPFAAAFIDAPSPRLLQPVARFSHGRSRREAEDQKIPQATADISATALSTPIPWYLQVDTPTPPAPSHSLSDRQIIPDLPHDPPTILPPMLSYLSEEAGLDELTLLDLRSLHPPPALGANLLMVMATARSVKHLNVSADRFCRWLRSNYKLRPFADGLLGRNELKLKLRRKARRAKLAASVGNTMYERGGGGADDGITTGWICVNVGQVEEKLGAPPSVEETDVVQQGLGEEHEEYVNPVEEVDYGEEQDDGYVGFGSRSTAPRIVVQMFTEEKRAEMDLEGLWQHRSTRRTRKTGRKDQAADSAKEEDRLEEADAALTLSEGNTGPLSRMLEIG